MEEKPVKASFIERPEIPRKPKKPSQPEANGHGHGNGEAPLVTGVESERKGIKRSHPGDEGQPAPTKKARMADSTTTNDVVVVEDAGGAIVIEDD